jgi:hypothetical protein
MTTPGSFNEDVCWIEPDFLLDALTDALALAETLALPPVEAGFLAGATMMQRMKNEQKRNVANR